MDQTQPGPIIGQLAQGTAGTGNGVATHASVQATTDAQTSWLTLMGWVRFGAYAAVTILSAFGVGVTVQKTTPAPAPEVLMKLDELYKQVQQQKGPPPVVFTPTPTLATPPPPDDAAIRAFIGKWLETEAAKAKEKK